MTATTRHGGDCGGTWCDFCGCCEHGPDSQGCRVKDAPFGMTCPGYGCGCEGDGWYDKPVQPAPIAEADDAPRDVQLHQESALDFGGWSTT